ncbi:hypothetical protein NIES4071_06330 [Calothrix sp. NIES-4071]|nr:hypothetical protein NIES4071_06330 [Calothrix sp. NIES-4071]BAZ54976.1 hypothetical protein NIES4105_06300 [Calothrix sp. NIES-4105]
MVGLTPHINDLIGFLSYYLRRQLYKKGFKGLVDALGYADAIRFIRQFDSGSGDYTTECHQWLDSRSNG